ncbi:MAG: hypothetical protein FJ213_12475 [Ignavibacteria bacterium]|nr:hypothetical protein [Ignavibacteria bacterium]
MHCNLLEFYFALFVFPLLHLSSVSAQTLSAMDTTIQLNATQIRTNYSKQLNIHTFTNSVSAVYNFNRFTVNAGNTFNSTFIDAVSKNIRDDNTFFIDSRYAIFDQFKLGGLFRSRIVTDNRRIGLSDVSENSFELIAEYAPIYNISVRPVLGYKLDKQLEQNDKGFIYGLNSIFDNVNLSNYLFNSNVKYLNEEIGRRNNITLNSSLSVNKHFTSDVFNSFNFEFNKITRDFYLKLDSAKADFFGSDLNIETRDDDVLMLSENLKYNNIFNFMDFEFIGGLYFRNVERNTLYKLTSPPSKNVFDTRIDEFRLNLGTRFKLRLGDFNSNFKANYTERDEKHIVKNISEIPENFYLDRVEDELKKNNSSVRFQLGSESAYNLVNHDTLYLNLFLSKLVYNTPSISNFTNKSNIFRDDRDELLYIARLTYKKFFSKFFSASIFVEAYMNHLVYIYAERSSNNNWNRVIRLASNSNYTDKVLTSSNSFEVLANYTIYDFEDILNTVRSFSFRQFSFTDTTQINLSKVFFTTVSGNIKLSEQGSLNWRSFSTKPARYIEEYSGELKLGYRLNHLSFFNLGIRTFRYIESRFEKGEKVENSRIESIGPVFDISVRFREDLYLIGTSWIEYISQSSKSTRRIVNFNLRILLTI